MYGSKYVPNYGFSGTYKMKKFDLQEEGFDPEKITDKLFYSNSSGSYQPLTKEIYEDIVAGKIRF